MNRILSPRESLALGLRFNPNHDEKGEFASSDSSGSSSDKKAEAAAPKTKKGTAKIEDLEKVSGPLLPGKGEDHNTITVKPTSVKGGYDFIGTPGIHELDDDSPITGGFGTTTGRPSSFHVHTPGAISDKVKKVTGISHNGHQHDPGRKHLADKWLKDNE